MTLINDTPAPVVVRFTVPSQDASFGFRLQPGEPGTGMARPARDRVLAGLRDDRGLRPPYQFDADPSVTAVSIGPTAAAAVDQPPGAFLDYAPDCAEVIALTAAASR